jgi:uncharacterized RDD family membrane protein YckC
VDTSSELRTNPWRFCFGDGWDSFWIAGLLSSPRLPHIVAVVFRSALILRLLGTIAGIYLLLYLWLADGLMNGQSYGKRLMETSVIDAITGAPCTFAKSFVRNALRFTPILVWTFISDAQSLRLALSFLILADALFMVGEKRQRLGDKLANRIVIETQQ